MGKFLVSILRQRPEHPWSSGYDTCLTRRRSPLQSWLCVWLQENLEFVSNCREWLEAGTGIIRPKPSLCKGPCGLMDKALVKIAGSSPARVKFAACLLLDCALQASGQTSVTCRGPVDKASAYGAGDCRFESYRDHLLKFDLSLLCFLLSTISNINDICISRESNPGESMATMYSATRPLMPLIVRTASGLCQTDAS